MFHRRRAGINLSRAPNHTPMSPLVRTQNTPKEGQIKAVGLTSGGLDSTLAALVLRRQGIHVLQVCFTTPFFAGDNALEVSLHTQIPLIIMDITREHLSMLQAPRHGFGKQMNPCIDCHILMLRTASRLLREREASFVFTGEVLGQRPMSQNRQALECVARESGLGGLLLRPLSARHLAPTIPEERGWVDRTLLHAFKGRSRKPQMKLAQELGLANYPGPAGGCLLTDEGFSRRLKDLFHFQEAGVELQDFELLKVGRHFRIADGLKLVVGRDQGENEMIESLRFSAGVLARTPEIPGPTVLAPRGISEARIPTMADLCATYGDAEDRQAVSVEIRTREGAWRVTGVSRDKGVFVPFLI